jgi:hypothetical protein
MSDDRNWDRMIVVTALHGERIHGWLPEHHGEHGEFNYQQDMQAAARQHEPVSIQHARNLVGSKDVKTDAQGRFLGVASMMALMPIDMFPGPMEEYQVIPSSWYFPGSMERSKKLMENLIKAAEASEMRSRAMEAGIHPPNATGMPTPNIKDFRSRL